MDDVAAAQSENENLRKIRERLMKWEAKENALASLSAQQEEYLESLTSIWNGQQKVKSSTIERNNVKNGFEDSDSHGFHQTISSSLHDLQNLSKGIENTSDFLVWYDRVHSEIHYHADDSCYKYLEQLKLRSNECSNIVYEIDTTLEKLEMLHTEYAFVANKTSALNTASEQLIEEQEKLQQLSDEIQRRLHYFNQVELLHQRLQSPTLSVASESFHECLNKIDECLEYLKVNPKIKDSHAYITKYNQCLSKALSLIKNYVNTVMSQATEATLHPKPQQANVKNDCSNTSSDIVFALYYGKYQTTAAKIKRISALVEERIHVSPEYEHLLSEIQQNYLIERVAIMSPAVDKAIKDLKALHKSDHCTLMRSACAFLVHVCEDEHRLFLNFFSIASEQLTSYLEGLCTILYDTMRPFIIHINHLETLAEICSIVRIEMIEEHVQQNPEPLAAFASTANQLLQDVQERLVFRAHLYLQSDILNYNPSAGDLAYPEKLEMMENIAMSLQESAQLRRSDSRSSLISSASSVIETESIDTAYRARNINSPADLHGMWYPTVRRTLVCLSRLYRCVDRPIFQGLSQDALRLCIQSVSAAAAKITSAKTSIDGYLFEIKHLLILREQIAPFRVDFTVKETSLDFSKVKTAAFGLLQKRKQLFSMGSNNALLEFLLEGTPQIKEHLVDSRKEVDRQLKTICEEFIRDAAQMLVGPISTFLDRAQTLLAASEISNDKDAASSKVNYALRQTSWAAPQQISSVIQETQRLIKSKLPLLQRSMQLYLSNRDTEYIILRPIRNNIIQAFVKLEHLLITNGYTSDDMIVTSCPSAEQVSILLSSASILAAEGIINFSAGVQRKISTSSNEGASISNAPAAGALHRKVGYEKKHSFENPSTQMMENLLEVPESGSSAESPATMSPVPPQDSISCELGT